MWGVMVTRPLQRLIRWYRDRFGTPKPHGIDPFPPDQAQKLRMLMKGVSR